MPTLANGDGRESIEKAIHHLRRRLRRRVPKARARLVLIDLRELAWHRARYRGEHCLFAPADPVLVSLNTLQHWLWLRLQASSASEVNA